MYKETVISKIEILESGWLQIQRSEYLVEDDGTRRLLGHHRVAHPPGAEIPDEDAQVRDVADLVWTPEVVQRHRDRVAAEAAARDHRRRQ